MTKTTEPTEITMRTKFPDNQISKLPKPTRKQTDEVKADFKAGARCAVCGGWHHPNVIHLDYVGHAALTDRMLDVDPNWNWKPMATTDDGSPVIDKDGGLWIELTVKGVTRLGYGDAGSKTGGDAMKERIGDALRNAAMRFGAALDLWHKGELHVDDSEPQKPVEAPAANFDAEIKAMKACGSLDALGKVWGKFDKPTQHALAAEKDACKEVITNADKE